MGERSGVQQMSQESYGESNFSPKCVKVNRSARLFMTLRIPPVLQTPTINLEWKSFVGQCICYRFLRRERTELKNNKIVKIWCCMFLSTSIHLGLSHCQGVFNMGTYSISVHGGTGPCTGVNIWRPHCSWGWVAWQATSSAARGRCTTGWADQH